MEHSTEFEVKQVTDTTVERWNIFELTLQGPSDGNPFTEIDFSAQFKYKHRVVKADGFYDGDGTYKARFMPDTLGTWSYVTKSNCDTLNAKTGEFTCTASSPGNHGPVGVRDTYHFAYEDGTPYFPVGTTCYAWVQQGDAQEEETLETLKSAPFNKLRMCVFPKDYVFNRNEPVHHPFEADESGGWDWTRFNPGFFRHFEKRIGELRDLGIEADVILLHPYDRWGYSNMPSKADDVYLRYAIARLAAYRNVWWSLANEYDFMKAKSEADWDRFFRIVQESDPYQHLRSVHNGARWYDHGKPWVTHASIQSHAVEDVTKWRERYRKPVVVDECRYEGDIDSAWGNITAKEMVRLFWEGTLRGGYVGHGETYLHPEDILWWSKGGVLHGNSPARIAFYRRVLKETPLHEFTPAPLMSILNGWHRYARLGKEDACYLVYFGASQPGRALGKLPAEHAYLIEIIDTWDMTVTLLEKTFRGEFTLELPGKPYIALRIRQAPEAS